MLPRLFLSLYSWTIRIGASHARAHATATHQIVALITATRYRRAIFIGVLTVSQTMPTPLTRGQFHPCHVYNHTTLHAKSCLHYIM